MTGELKDRLFETGRLVLVSFAQIAFTQKPLQGVLVFLTIFLLAPFSALGAVIGAFVSVVWGTRFGQSVEDRHSGQAGVDTIILGILWGGALAQDLSMDWLFALALMACLSLQAPVGRLMAKLALPPLAVSALLIAWISHGVFKTFSAHFWNHPGLLPFGNWGIVAAICLIAVAFFWRSWRGALLCAVAVVVAAFGSGWALTELGAIGPAGLWAFSVAPAAFGVAGGYLSGTPLGLKGGVFAAALAAVVWLGWVFSPLALVLPPLLAPVFLGIWGALWLVLGAERSAVLNVPLMKTVDLIRSTKAQGGKVTVLSGAVAVTPEPLPTDKKVVRLSDSPGATRMGVDSAWLRSKAMSTPLTPA